MKDGAFALSQARRRWLLRQARKCQDRDERSHYMIIVHSAKGEPVKEIAEAVGCGTATLTRARQRCRKHGEAGLIVTCLTKCGQYAG